MSVRKKEELMESVKSILGENDSDEALSFIEDISDTLDASSNSSSKTDEEWEQDIATARSEVDAEWRKKYKDRFFNSGNNDDFSDDDEPDEEETKPTKFEDLFGKE